MKSNRIQTMLFDSSATSTAILFLMLSVRLTDNYLADWIFTSEIPAWFNYLYAFSLYILTTLLLWLNKKKLIDMNIDFSSVNIFLFGGTLLFFYVPRELGWVLIATMIFFYLGTKNDLPRTNKKSIRCLLGY